MRGLETRIPPPALAMVWAAAMWGVARVSPLVVLPQVARHGVVALLLMLAGLLTAPALRAFRAARTTVNPTRPESAATLVSSGVYRFTRNPMYVSLTALLLAWTVWLGAPWDLLMTAGFVAYVQCFQILPEERALRAKFGSAYAAYQSRVRRWV